MSTQATESIDPVSPERPAAALFINGEELSVADLFQISESFYLEHDSLLQKRCGVVVQIDHDLDSPGELVDITETLIFDARNRSSDVYTWELTHGQGGARKIWQLEVGPESVSGRRCTTSNQGVQIGEVELGDDELELTFARVISLIQSSSAAENIQEKLERRERAQQKLAEFVLEADLKKLTSTARYEADRQRHARIIDAVGLTPLTPYLPRRNSL